ncbi:MAG: DUF2865 domain-containing protein [Hyphomicrobiaceae bacterium]
MSKAGTGWLRGLWLVLVLGVAAPLAPEVFRADRAAAQSGWWPWASESEPARRPPPVRREPPPTWRPPAEAPYAGGQYPAQRGTVCLQLEQRLVDFQRGGDQSKGQLPAIENEMRQLDRNVRSGERQLERSDCYDYFLFSKSLRRTRRCVDAAGQLENDRRRLAELDAQRKQILGLGQRDRGYQDDLIRELARNNCGPQYQQEAARRHQSTNPFSSLWQDEDSDQSGRGNEFRSMPFATYRTVCVRLCDGFYFPISFSTLENHFSRDAEACQSKCAAPVDLYFHQNPGGSMDQAVSVTDRRPYTSLKSAFRYRKEFISGCSCKQSEYTPSPADQGARKAEAPPPSRQARRP